MLMRIVSAFLAIGCLEDQSRENDNGGACLSYLRYSP